MTIPCRTRSALAEPEPNGILIFGLVAAIAMAATLAACGEQAPKDPLLDSPLAIHDGEWSGDDGAIEGRLELRGECLYLSSSGGMRLLPVFGRDGLEWDAKASAVRIEGVAFPVSRPVRFGGAVA